MIYVIHEEYMTKNVVILDLISGDRANKLHLRSNEPFFFKPLVPASQRIYII